MSTADTDANLSVPASARHAAPLVTLSLGTGGSILAEFGTQLGYVLSIRIGGMWHPRNVDRCPRLPSTAVERTVVLADSSVTVDLSDRTRCGHVCIQLVSYPNAPTTAPTPWMDGAHCFQ